jgi:hypothetical protein
MFPKQIINVEQSLGRSTSDDSVPGRQSGLIINHGKTLVLMYKHIILADKAKIHPKYQLYNRMNPRMSEIRIKNERPWRILEGRRCEDIPFIAYFSCSELASNVEFCIGSKCYSITSQILSSPQLSPALKNIPFTLNR